MTRIDFETSEQAQVEYNKRLANGETVAIGYSFEDRSAFVLVFDGEVQEPQPAAQPAEDHDEAL